MEKCKRMKRQLCMSKNWIHSWLWKSSKTRQQSHRQESFTMNTDTHTSGSTVKNHISLKMVFEYSVIHKTSYQSWFLVYQRVLPQARLLQHPWNLQRKLIIPRLRPAIVSSESVDRQVRREPYSGTDHHLEIVSSESVHRQVRGYPYSSETSEELLTKPTQIQKPKKIRIPSRYGETRIIPTYRNGCKNSKGILWMKEFLNAETHTPVLLMNYL